MDIIRHKKRLRRLVKELKTKECRDCGIYYGWWVNQFDHINPKEKTGTVSELIKQGVSDKRLLKEIAKCEVVCANCHLTREFKRKKS